MVGNGWGNDFSFISIPVDISIAIPTDSTYALVFTPAFSHACIETIYATRGGWL